MSDELIREALKRRYDELCEVHDPGDARAASGRAASLQAYAIGDETATGGPPGDPSAFLRLLDENRGDRAAIFGLLSERYKNPADFTLRSEANISEFVLMRIMVNDRQRVERDGASAIDDCLLLMLNLIAVHARKSSDLRFLDALNYFYEIVPTDFRSATGDGWLSISYLSLYRAALQEKCE